MAAAGGYVLSVLSPGSAEARRFVLAPGEHLVGSLAGADVRLEEAGVSRRHAAITVCADGGVVVRDLGSKNGTYAGDRRLAQVAASGALELQFGPVRASLAPSGASDVLLEPGTADRTPPPSPPPAPTESLELLERLIAPLERVLPRLCGSAAAPEEAATDLLRRWVRELPITRAEILRSPPSPSQVVLAAASAAGRAGDGATSLDVAGPGGLTLRLRTTQGPALRSLDPVLRLALGLLAESLAGAVGEGAAEARVSSGELGALPAGLGVEMQAIYRRARKVAHGEVSVLVLGESGVGKEVLASWIHARSPRAQGPFLALNCAALPRELLEAELFGIERGVATGVEARPGVLERAAGGTVFLDEIGDMAPETQAKVLRVLESTTLFRLGGRKPLAVDVRFVAATNRDLAALVARGEFRLDLYHRLAGFEVTLPPLRRRKEEIPALAALFFHRALERARSRSPGITREAVGALVRYSWPGNVRELANEVARAALLLERNQPLDLDHLSERVRQAAAGAPAGSALSLGQAVTAAEREAFRVALAAASGEGARAIALLGVSKTTFYRKLKELGLT